MQTFPMRTAFHPNILIKYLWCSRISVLILFLVTFNHVTNGQNFHLVKDINTMAEGSPRNSNNYIFPINRQSHYAVLNGVSYFSADDGSHGRGLWRSDGTAAGTYQVKGSINPDNIIVSDGKLIFIAGGKLGLWTSDGTGVGTVPVLNVIPAGLVDFIPYSLIDMNGVAFFTITGQRTQLWKTDGTSNGTVLVKNLSIPVGGYNSFNMINLTPIKNKLYFTANTSFDNYSTRLWVSDGSSAGTYMVSNMIAAPGQMIARSSDNADPVVYFSASTYEFGTRSLYSTNGQPGNAVITPGFNGIIAGNYFNEEILNIGGVIYFIGGPDTSLRAQSLYKFDINTADGIRPVKVVTGTGVYGSTSYVYSLTEMNGTLFFSVSDAPNNKNQFWKSNGSTAGNILLIDSFSYDNYLKFGGQLYISGSDNIHGQELWKSDGTISGTSLLKDINPGRNASAPLYATFANGKILFSANDGIHGTELWQSDGTTTGTSLLKDINQTTTSSSVPYGAVSFSNTVFFAASKGGGDNNLTLWKSDGTNTGTTAIGDTVYLNMGLSPKCLTVMNSEGYFWAATVPGNPGLYKTNDTSGATKLVKSFIGNTIQFNWMTGADHLLYFSFYNIVDKQHELWRTDGTEANTIKVKTSPNYNLELVSSGDTLYFVTANGLWMSDGSINGTVLLRTFTSDPTNLTVSNGKLFFTALDGSISKIWKSDGTLAGTVKVTDDLTNPANLVAFKGKLCFTATDYTGAYGKVGTELFITDGRVDGTLLVKDIHKGGVSSNLSLVNSLNGSLYFFADGATFGVVELWKSDGTLTGTQKISNVGNGKAELPYKMVGCNNKLFFLLSDTLWESDGLQAGTHIVADNIFAGVKITSYNGNLTSAGNQVFFAASNYQYGQELYAGNVTAPVLNYASVADGNWNNPAIWMDNVVPPEGYNVTIRSKVVGNINTTCNSLSIESPGALTVNTGINIAVLH
ncbi:MAG: Flagellar hook-length control protein FliK [Ferruginibacter sp.]|nr:Flagellar hook-length control protein FliK [Ferruginibacter sp.]